MRYSTDIKITYPTLSIPENSSFINSDELNASTLFAKKSVIQPENFRKITEFIGLKKVESSKA